VDSEHELGERVAALERWSEGVQAIITTLLGSVDHIHDDLVGMREWMRIPRPECYPVLDQHRQEEDDR